MHIIIRRNIERKRRKRERERERKEERERERELTVSLSSYPLRSTSSKLFSATSRRASLGHSVNQSMVVQLTKAGYCLKRFLKTQQQHNNIMKIMKKQYGKIMLLQ